MSARRGAVAWLAAGGLLAALAAPAQAGRYAPQGSCAGHPGVALKVPDGWCAALVADADDGLRMPRRVLPVGPQRLWVVDMGSWEPRQGRLLEIQPQRPRGDPLRVRVLARGLDRPHGLVRGPDGRVYVGEAGTVWRTPVGDTVQREDVLTGLPDDGAHPLKELAFGPDGRLFLNVGSGSDACRRDDGSVALPCPETQGERPRAAVWVATLGGPGHTVQDLRPYATGLRNALGLAFTTGPGGRARLWQAENSVDYVDADEPAEELNELSDGSDHGWPGCVSDARGRAVATRGAEGRARCGRTQAPVMAWPAHAAPLQLLAVPPVATTPTPPWSGHLLAVWHGHRSGGHRVVGWRLDGFGRPTGERTDFVSGWRPMPGVRPLGSPAGAAVDDQGRLWIVEDRNRSLLLIAPAP